MPKMYEDIRDSYVKSGKSYDEAQKLAAMTYNARRREHPDMPALSNKPEGSKRVKLRVKKPKS
jgi:hypothetical protein